MQAKPSTNACTHYSYNNRILSAKSHTFLTILQDDSTKSSLLENSIQRSWAEFARVVLPMRSHCEPKTREMLRDYLSLTASVFDNTEIKGVNLRDTGSSARGLSE